MSDSYKERERQQEFIEKMIANGYELFKPSSYKDIKKNFKEQIEYINDIKLSNREFEKLYNKVDQGNVFERSFRLLREDSITLDNGDTKVFRLMNKKHWCQNKFQIAQEVETNVSGVDGRRARFDSIIFINGLPLVIMEFKQSIRGKNLGIEQIVNYKKTGKMHGLFLNCQIFIASSFATTRYFANNNKINRDFIFKWTDEDNKEISSLIDGKVSIYDTLLSRCFMAEMIVRYMIRQESNQINIILRPYQVYATKKILQKVEENSGNGYIFHTTGSGKTITSFKTCRLLLENEKIDKVIFLVDRKDLDAQTKSAYDEFEPGCYDGASNSSQLKRNMFSKNNKIVIGTIQKMTRVINKLTDNEIQELLSKRVAIIIDECHRSQSDQTTNTLRKVFKVSLNTQYFGFTGTPIFDENSKTGDVYYETTNKIFDRQLHKYSITDAVKDENVLQFNISQPKEVAVEKIDFMNEKRIESISKYIIDNFDIYTDNRVFNTIFATHSKDQLKLYYKYLKDYNKMKPDNEQIKFSCIFSTNPDDFEEYVSSENQEVLFVKEVIGDFNSMFKTNITINDIEIFKNKIYDSVRKKDLDLILVVNMLLTGFDSPVTKTLFVDKNLKYHTLLQAYSRVNRKKENKRYGNVVTFIDQKGDRDDALRLFAAGGSYSDFEIVPYDQLVKEFNELVEKEEEVFKNPDTIRNQLDVGDRKNLIKNLEAIKELQKKYLFLKVHPDFKEEDIKLTKREMNDSKDVYRETYRSFKNDEHQVENHDDEVEQLGFDFEIEDFNEDNINLEYLLKLTETTISKDGRYKALDKIDGYEISKEVREALKEVVQNYHQEDFRTMNEKIQEVLEKNEKTQYYDIANENDIKNIEKFMELVLEQKRGNVSQSQSIKYDVVLESGNFSKKEKKGRKFII